MKIPTPRLPPNIWRRVSTSRFLWPVLALACIGAASVTNFPFRVMRISDYPHTSVPGPSDLFLLARTNVAMPTNQNIRWDELAFAITNSLPPFLNSNFVANLASNLVRVAQGTNSLVSTGYASGGIIYTVSGLPDNTNVTAMFASNLVRVLRGTNIIVSTNFSNGGVNYTVNGLPDDTNFVANLASNLVTIAPGLNVTINTNYAGGKVIYTVNSSGGGGGGGGSTTNVIFYGSLTMRRTTDGSVHTTIDTNSAGDGVFATYDGYFTHLFVLNGVSSTLGGTATNSADTYQQGPLTISSNVVTKVASTLTGSGVGLVDFKYSRILTNLAAVSTNLVLTNLNEGDQLLYVKASPGASVTIVGLLATNFTAGYIPDADTNGSYTAFLFEKHATTTNASVLSEATFELLNGTGIYQTTDYVNKQVTWSVMASNANPVFESVQANHGFLYLTNSMRSGETNIVIASTNRVDLHVQNWGHIKLSILSDARLRIVGATNGIPNVLLTCVNDTNGNHSILNFEVDGGILRTNGYWQVNTNASGMDTFSLHSDYYPSNFVIEGRAESAAFVDPSTNVLTAFNTRYTNTITRAWPSITCQVTSSGVGTTGSVSLVVERIGFYTNKITQSVGGGTATNKVTLAGLPLGPFDIFYITNDSLGGGATLLYSNFPRE